MKSFLKGLLSLTMVALAHSALAQTEDGYELWMRYRELPVEARAQMQALVAPAGASPMVQAAVAELKRGIAQMSGREPAMATEPRAGALVLVTPASLPGLGALNLQLSSVGDEGYVLRSQLLNGQPVTLIAANTDRGLLYGSFAWLRAAGMGADLSKLDQVSAPKIQWRMLNHWDNPDRSVERGYAGLSIWDWQALPDVRGRQLGLGTGSRWACKGSQARRDAEPGLAVQASGVTTHGTPCRPNPSGRGDLRRNSLLPARCGGLPHASPTPRFAPQLAPARACPKAQLPPQRYVDYARANASLGINATVLNNVNAKAEVLTALWLKKVAAVADVLRPYGIRVFLSARFSAPKEAGLPKSDPLDPRVRAWWKAKADEIYALVPDFGGFLVKANSEGEPGPQDYGRSHADGANMLAEALAPHKGLVIWRAFVYSEVDPDDRAKQAYSEFVPLDGKFAANVIVQVKNGAIDFQPREPFHPLFGAMPKTALGLELQITKEYLGFATHMAYLGPMYEEVLRADTHRFANATVARIISSKAHPSLMAGVANIGSDRNWSGSHFNQANWYVFGRMAWDPDLSAEAVAREWVAQTFSRDPRAIASISALMMGSREAVVNYMTPLGLAHLMATGHHYGPGPWVSDLARPEWNPAYYHKADSQGIGFDRTSKGSKAVSQYALALAQQWSDPKTTPPELMLWFHHLSWDAPLSTGRTVWAELIHRYDAGVQSVVDMRQQWSQLTPYVDAQRHAEVAAFLAIQEREARWWRDACIAYFQSVSKRPLPPGVVAPALTLEQYRAMHFSFAPGYGG